MSWHPWSTTETSKDFKNSLGQFHALFQKECPNYQPTTEIIESKYCELLGRFIVAFQRLEYEMIRFLACIENDLLKIENDKTITSKFAHIIESLRKTPLSDICDYLVTINDSRNYVTHSTWVKINSDGNAMIKRKFPGNSPNEFSSIKQGDLEQLIEMTKRLDYLILQRIDSLFS
jgi:hypothetical protein